MSAYSISKPEPSQAQELCEVCCNSFYETFVGTCSEEDMKKYLSNTYPLTRIASEITSNDCLLFIIKDENKICGYAKVGWQIIEELKHRNAIEIERLYILKEYIGKGLGNLLMQKCLEIATGKAVDVIYLGVWEHNYRAQNFYSKYGFEVFGSHPFPIESTPQTDLWMKKELR